MLFRSSLSLSLCLSLSMSATYISPSTLSSVSLLTLSSLSISHSHPLPLPPPRLLALSPNFPLSLSLPSPPPLSRSLSQEDLKYQYPFLLDIVFSLQSAFCCPFIVKTSGEIPCRNILSNAALPVSSTVCSWLLPLRPSGHTHTHTPARTHTHIHKPHTRTHTHHAHPERDWARGPSLLVLRSLCQCSRGDTGPNSDGFGVCLDRKSTSLNSSHL